MLKHQPKTLAKVLDYIARRSPGEYGLFWDPDGAMPWKEFYWALQEDPSLRFVRESTIRELALLGIELPFVLDGNLLRLRPEVAGPCYPPASDVPERLYFGIKTQKFGSCPNNWFKSSGRRFIAVCAERELALRIARTTGAVAGFDRNTCSRGFRERHSFLVAGPHLYLVQSVPVEFILFPKFRQDFAERLAGRAGKPADKPSPPPAPGSFIVEPHHFEAQYRGKIPGKGVKNDDSAQGWKKARRKERHKRDI